MPDKRAGSWRGMWPGRDVAAYAKSVFSMQFSVTFTSFFPNIRDCFLRKKKKRELGTQFSFLCMSTTVSGSNSLIFAIIGDQSLEVWQREWLAIPTQPNLPSSSSLFFSCLLPNISEESIFRNKDSAGDIPKERRRNQFNQWRTRLLRPVGQVSKAIFACLTIDEKRCLYLYFLAFLYFLEALLMAKVSYHRLKKYQRVASLSLRRILNQCFFLSTLMGPQTCFLFVCEHVSIRLSDCKWGNSPPAKVKPVED